MWVEEEVGDDGPVVGGPSVSRREEDLAPTDVGGQSWRVMTVGVADTMGEYEVELSGCRCACMACREGGVLCRAGPVDNNPVSCGGHEGVQPVSAAGAWGCVEVSCEDSVSQWGGGDAEDAPEGGPGVSHGGAASRSWGVGEWVAYVVFTEVGGVVTVAGVGVGGVGGLRCCVDTHELEAGETRDPLVPVLVGRGEGECELHSGSAIPGAVAEVDVVDDGDPVLVGRGVPDKCYDAPQS